MTRPSATEKWHGDGESQQTVRLVSLYNRYCGYRPALHTRSVKRIFGACLRVGHLGYLACNSDQIAFWTVSPSENHSWTEAPGVS